MPSRHGMQMLPLTFFGSGLNNIALMHCVMPTGGRNFASFSVAHADHPVSYIIRYFVLHTQYDRNVACFMDSFGKNRQYLCVKCISVHGACLVIRHMLRFSMGMFNERRMTQIRMASLARRCVRIYCNHSCSAITRDLHTGTYINHATVVKKYIVSLIPLNPHWIELIV